MVHAHFVQELKIISESIGGKTRKYIFKTNNVDLKNLKEKIFFAFTNSSF